jgi:GPH family glycoside/pentoside/hexuronide:cation symporter
MFQGDTQTGMIWKANLSLGYAVMGFITIPLLTAFSSRYSKRKALTLVYILFALSGIVKWFVFTPGSPIKIMLDPLIGAPIWIGIAMILPSMMADVCDEDERRHYKRREGMFGAMYSWVQKTGFSLAFLGAGVALNIVGFDEQLGGNQSPETILGIRIIFVGGVILTALLALFTLQFYPISPERALETRKELEARRGKV